MSGIYISIGVAARGICILEQQDVPWVKIEGAGDEPAPEAIQDWQDGTGPYPFRPNFDYEQPQRRIEDDLAALGIETLLTFDGICG